MADQHNAAIDHLAPWSTWVPFTQAVTTAPRQPGAYIAGETDGSIIYVGMAGLRDNGGKASPMGIQGRLRRYASGKAIASGLGEAVLDRALADSEWLGARMAEVAAGTPSRALEWGRLAFLRADLQICWATTPDGESARMLERAATHVLKEEMRLWNRALQSSGGPQP